MIGFLAGAALWVALVLFLRSRRSWVLYYVTAAVGFTLLAVSAARGTVVEEWLEALTAVHTHIVAGWIGVPTLVFENAPGTMLVLVAVGRVGWTAIKVGIECSGLLELAAFSGLLVFYPGLAIPRRLLLLGFGLGATYAINILRLLVIVSCLHWGGKELIVPAHAIIGRGVFFILVIAVYWFVFTRTAVATVRRKMAQTGG